MLNRYLITTLRARRLFVLDCQREIQYERRPLRTLCFGLFVVLLAASHLTFGDEPNSDRSKRQSLGYDNLERASESPGANQYEIAPTPLGSLVEDLDFFHLGDVVNRVGCEVDCLYAIRGAFQTMVIEVNENHELISKPKIYDHMIASDDLIQVSLPSEKAYFPLRVGPYHYGILNVNEKIMVIGESEFTRKLPDTPATASQVAKRIDTGFSVDECPVEIRVVRNECMKKADASCTVFYEEEVRDCYDNFLEIRQSSFDLPASVCSRFFNAYCRR